MLFDINERQLSLWIASNARDIIRQTENIYGTQIRLASKTQTMENINRVKIMLRIGALCVFEGFIVFSTNRRQELESKLQT